MSTTWRLPRCAAGFSADVRRGYGRIVLTSSIGGLYGNHEVANYAIAKAGVIGLSNVAAMEGAAEGVKSNVIVPAAVTRMAEGIDTVGVSADGPGACGARGGLARARNLFHHRGDPASTGRPGGTGSVAETPGCTGRRGPSPTSANTWRRSATRRIPSSFRSSRRSRRPHPVQLRMATQGAVRG